jgi:ABC-type enterochelin transport system permease subunit
MIKKLSNIILYSGCLILIASLIYMIINLSRADSIIHIWLPFVAAGTIFVFISTLINLFYKPNNKEK